jgi:hypothetical protein
VQVSDQSGNLIPNPIITADSTRSRQPRDRRSQRLEQFAQLQQPPNIVVRDRVQPSVEKLSRELRDLAESEFQWPHQRSQAICARNPRRVRYIVRAQS